MGSFPRLESPASLLHSLLLPLGWIPEAIIRGAFCTVLSWYRPILSMIYIYFFLATQTPFKCGSACNCTSLPYPHSFLNYTSSFLEAVTLWVSFAPILVCSTLIQTGTLQDCWGLTIIKAFQGATLHFIFTNASVLQPLSWLGVDCRSLCQLLSWTPSTPSPQDSPCPNPSAPSFSFSSTPSVVISTPPLAFWETILLEATLWDLDVWNCLQSTFRLRWK